MAIQVVYKNLHEVFLQSKVSAQVVTGRWAPAPRWEKSSYVARQRQRADIKRSTEQIITAENSTDVIYTIQQGRQNIYIFLWVWRDYKSERNCVAYRDFPY